MAIDSRALKPTATISTDDELQEERKMSTNDIITQVPKIEMKQSRHNNHSGKNEIFLIKVFYPNLKKIGVERVRRCSSVMFRIL